MKKNYIFLFLFILFNLSSFSQTLEATLLELNFFGNSNPQNFISDEFKLFFVANDGTHGDELWISDGTVLGTVFVKDIRPGWQSSEIGSMVIIDGILFFSANDGVHGNELWRSDGTDIGTYMIRDIRVGNNDSINVIFEITEFNGKAFFTTTDNINNNDNLELWVSDGTESGTIMLKDIFEGDNGSYPSNYFIFNDQLFFIANDGIHSTELWVSDGTADGTRIFKDINPSSNGLQSGNQFLVLDGEFYFYATDGVHGLELWKSDGTGVGTKMVKDIRENNFDSSNVLKGDLLNNVIIFKADDGISGSELWRSDGTELGTYMIKDINQNFGSLTGSNNTFIKLNNEVYFIADDGIHGNELWRTDGNLSGTKLLKDVKVGAYSSSIKHMRRENNQLFFSAYENNTSNRTFWRSDGTESGTYKLSSANIRNISDFNFDYVSFNNTVFFGLEDNFNGNELWFTDGTTSGTNIFKDLNHAYGSNPSIFTDVNGELYFMARGFEEYGNQLFKSDGTVLGTKMLKDINPSYISIRDESGMRNINGNLFFNANNGTNGFELWKSDGTESGTLMIKDIYPGSNSSLRKFDDFYVIENKLYFMADDGIHGFELWVSDGSEIGTYMIKDIRPGGYNVGSYPSHIVSLNNLIYFAANESVGYSLWSSDGTELGTNKVKHFSFIRKLTEVNNKLYMIVGGLDTDEFWVSDGTEIGSKLLLVFGRGSNGTNRFMTSLNEEVYFVADSPESWRKSIYKSDGTIEGTILLFDGINHTLANIDINNIFTCGNYVYFGIQDSSSGVNNELWRTDGTVDGTIKIAGSDTDDFLYLRNFTCLNENLFYVAEGTAQKIWSSNGHPNGTIQLDIQVNNGLNFSGNDNIDYIGASGGKLYFEGRNNISGSELYVTTPSVSTLDISEYNIINDNEKLNIKIYPNPSNGLVNLSTISDNFIEAIDLYNVTGKKILHIKNKNSTKTIIMNLETLLPGIYFLKIYLERGSYLNTKLIIN